MGERLPVPFERHGFEIVRGTSELTFILAEDALTEISLWMVLARRFVQGLFPGWKD